MIFKSVGSLFHRVSLAFSTVPSIVNWQQVAAIVSIASLISLLIGFKSGFLNLEGVRSKTKAVGITIYCFITPALTEELFFRVLLLPHPTEKASPQTLWLCGIASLVIFVVYHPLNALTFYPVGCPTFMNPVFLVLAAIVGTACAIAYLLSGSLWPPVLIHWLTVIIWLLFLGGYRRLNRDHY